MLKNLKSITMPDCFKVNIILEQKKFSSDLYIGN